MPPPHPECGAEPRTRQAYRLMQQVYADCKRQWLTPEQTDLAIRAAYPWGERRGWRYRAWLIARREFYETHALPLKPRRSIAQAIRDTRV